MDPLIIEGVHCGIHTTLTLVDSHHGGIDFDDVGRGYAPRKCDGDILTIGSNAAHRLESLASKVLADCIRRQFQSLGI